MIESAAARRRGRGSPGVETATASADSALARAPHTLSMTTRPFSPETNALRALLDAARDELGWASTRTADPALADDARPTTCPVCLTDLDPEGFCSCCGRVIV